MALNADLLLDRLALKRQLTRWRILAVLLLILLLLAATGRLGKHHTPNEDYIARLSISDVILDDPAMEALLEDAASDPHMKALVVRLNTPGGSAVAGQELYLGLRGIAQYKPVVAVMRDLAASAGYLAALGADRIYAREGTLTGSIGVLIQAAEVTELAEKLGIKPIAIKSSPLKATPSPFEKYTPQEAEVMNALVQDFHEVFLNIVAERRHLSKSVAQKLGDGRVYSGRQAVEYKLVDAIGGEADALDWLRDEKKISDRLPVIDIEPEREELPWLEEALGSVVPARWLQGATGKLDGLRLIWQRNSL